MRLLVAVAVLSAALCASDAAAEPSKTVRILYTPSWYFSEDIDLAYPVEVALSTGPGPAVPIRSILQEISSYSGDRILVRPPKAGGARLPAVADPVTALRDVDVLESENSILVGPAALIERVAAGALDLRSVNFRPGVRRRKARLGVMKGPDGTPYDVLLLDGGRPSGDWMQMFTMQYDLAGDGAGTLTVLAKPKARPSQLFRAFKDRIREAGGRPVLFNLGGLGVPSGVPDDTLLKPISGAGVQVHALDASDTVSAWQELFRGTAPAAGPGDRLLCSNLDPVGAPEGRIVRTHVEERDGLRIGFFSVVSRAELSAALAGAEPAFRALDPVEAAQAAMKSLRPVPGTEPVDAVVGILRLRPEEAAILLERLEGIDVAILEPVHDASRRKVQRVEVSGWSRWGQPLPALVTQPFAGGVGDLTLRFDAGPDGPMLAGVDEEGGRLDWRLQGDSAFAAYEVKVDEEFGAPEEMLLPDPRTVWPEAAETKRQYTAAEFYGLAAQLLKRRTRAEVALLKMSLLASNVPGEVPASFVRQWLHGDPKVAVLTLPGSALRELRGRVVVEEAPVVIFSDRRRYHTETWLAAAGLGREGTVDGLPIQDDELYSVAVHEDMLRDEGLRVLLEAHRTETMDYGMREVVMETLRRRRGQLGGVAGMAGEVRDLAEGKAKPVPVWRLHLRDVSLDFSNVRVQDGARLPAVPDSRVQAIDQLQTQASAALFSELYWRKLRWDAGVTAEYGRLTLYPPGGPVFRTESADRLLVESQLLHRTWSFARNGDLGPYARMAYDTELQRDPGVPLRRLLDFETGLKLAGGRFLREAYAGAIAERDNTTSAPNTEYGLTTGLRWESRLGGSPTTVKAQASYLHFAPSRDDTPDDLLRRLEASLRLGVPLPGEFHLAPFVKFFLFEGKVIHRTGYNLQTGVSLQFSRLWKPSY